VYISCFDPPEASQESQKDQNSVSLWLHLIRFLKMTREGVCPDIGKLEALGGWKPQVRFEDGLRRTITLFFLKQCLALETLLLSSTR